MSDSEIQALAEALHAETWAGPTVEAVAAVIREHLPEHPLLHHDTATGETRVGPEPSASLDAAVDACLSAVTATLARRGIELLPDGGSSAPFVGVLNAIRAALAQHWPTQPAPPALVAALRGHIAREVEVTESQRSSSSDGYFRRECKGSVSAYHKVERILAEHAAPVPWVDWDGTAPDAGGGRYAVLDDDLPDQEAELWRWIPEYAKWHEGGALLEHGDGPTRYHPVPIQLPEVE